MAVIPYLNPGDKLAAADWNTLFAEVDARLHTLCDGLSAVLALDNNYRWDRCFFFFDPIQPPASLNAWAQSFLASFPYPSWNPYFRRYDDAALRAQISGLVVLATSAKFGVAKLAAPDKTAWWNALYGGWNTVPQQEPALDISLAVLKVTVNETDYAVTWQDVTTAEHRPPARPALPWPA